MYQIKLYKTTDGWVAQWDDPQVKLLFGTDVLPTAFTAAAEGWVVQKAIQKLNPEYPVILRTI